MSEKPVVAFLGPKASYTHQAALSEFPDAKYDVQPHVSIEDVFSAVQSGAASHGVVPFENSSNGSVIFTLDLFADLNNRHPDILVEGEVYLPVRHCLLGYFPSKRRTSSSSSHERRRTDLPWRKSLIAPDESCATPASQAPQQSGRPRAQPNCDLKHIKKLYSHPQAWGQCKLFLSTYLKGIERQDVSSTSKAAEYVAADHTGTSAAISAKLAADLNGLTVLAEGIEDNEGNATRFFIIRRRRQNTIPIPQAPIDEELEMTSYKTLVSFTVTHGSPGALADSLAVFKKHNLNLTSINTRPSGEGPWQYIFFVEFKGRKRSQGSGGAVNDALDELGTVANNSRWLGSWENKLKG